MVGIIGNFLTPILLVSLAVIIIRGLMADSIPGLNENPQTNFAMFKHGFIAGYKTFDIFAALFFASAIIPAFQVVLGKRLETCKASLIKLALQSSAVGIFLLFAVYAGLSYVAANLHGGLSTVTEDKLLGTIATMTMGPIAGLMANLVVSMACLTTAISLAVVSAEFFRREIFFNKISYLNNLIMVMAISLGFACLGFSGIMTFVLPILAIICPAVITLIIVNGLNYFTGFKYIKTPVYGVFIITVLVMFFS